MEWKEEANKYLCGGEGACEKDGGEGGHMCACISKMENVYIHTCMYIPLSR